MRFSTPSFVLAAGLLVPMAAGSAQVVAPAAPAQAARPSIQAEQLVQLHGRFTIGEQQQRQLELWGTPRQRGFAHGYLLAREILLTFDRDFAVVMGKRVKQYAVLSMTVLPRFEFSEAEVDMLDGMLAGIKARLPAKADRRIAILSRAINLTDLKALNTFGDWVALGCSTIAMWGERSEDGHPVIARNFEFRSFRALLEHAHVAINAPYLDADGEAMRGTVTIGHPGCIGSLTGMNDDGVWTSIHDVYKQPGMKHAMRPNVPRLCAQRRILEELSAGRVCVEAEKRLRDWSTLFGNNFFVVDPRPKPNQPYAAVFEYDNRTGHGDGVTMRVVDRVGADGAEWLVCTNHHRVRGVAEEWKPSCTRYRALAEFAQGRADVFDVPRLFALANEAAMPKGDRIVVPVGMEGRKHGTLHQVVGRTGARELHVKLMTKGFGHIRDQQPVRYRVGALLEALPTEPVAWKADAGTSGAGG